MDLSDLGVWDGYKLLSPSFNHEQAPSLRDDGPILWTLRCYRGTSLRGNSSTNSSFSRNLKVRPLLLLPIRDPDGLRIRQFLQTSARRDYVQKLHGFDTTKR